METGELFEWEYYALVKIIQRVLDKNHEKHLASFEAQGIKGEREPIRLAG